MKVNSRNHLEIGGCDTVRLAKKFGTPLYVIDEQLVRETCRRYYNSFVKKHGGVVLYASKAFMNMAMARLIDEEGLGLDVVSGGEIYTALQADFPMEKVYFNGNNKSPDELILALKSGVSRIIVDNFYELEILNYIAGTLGKKADILIRITPGIEAHTHEYIMTGQLDSKFGFNVPDGQAMKAIKMAIKMPNLNLKGIHCHIGSQIFEMNSYKREVEITTRFIKQIKDETGYEVEELDLGGGFGVYYTEEDNPSSIEDYAEVVFETLEKMVEELDIIKPRVIIEPGRSIIANAGTTLYTVGAIKDIPGVRKYISVDGGMTDNPRLALYGAKYEAVIANKVFEENSEVVSIAGKCCESGDMLIWDVRLPHVVSGDIIAVMSTGAYNYSMASNYNRLTKPAVVLVKDGRADVIVKRETYEDLLRNDVIPARLSKKCFENIGDVSAI
ncbi:diaminopimelate decarboxylase [Caldanaerobius polysaccharolyticus]|uniref:diaminopimelate decarboxylase n=1 Tax=Caldanaerobius polysaccharolyticus TaxID=44256 RepID=UPI00055949E4|nr:diaminopimelate decarboxylase [Caldanaerobius polysaccharolyticus]